MELLIAIGLTVLMFAGAWWSWERERRLRKAVGRRMR